nr:pre-mRNA splicing Prp18-interacting factor [Tanacetum cinerariifolium]
MSTFVLCVGCGTPLYGFSPCQWCTCESCGNDLRDGFCALCNSRNSCVYDPNPNSFDCPPDSNHPPHPAYETYSCDSYGNDSYFGYDCQPQFPLNYESELGYNDNYNSYPYDSSSFPQQGLCCEDCGVLLEADHCQPPQYTVNHPIFNAHNDLFNANNDLLNSQNKITIAQNKLMEQLTSMCAMIPACCDDDEDDFAITPNEPVDSLEFTTFSNILFNADYEFDSSDDQSCSNEDVSEKKISNPLFEEEIIHIKIDQHHDNAESTHDSSLTISSKIDSLLDEFAGELILLKSILPGIDETDCHLENEIRFSERL